MDKLRMRFRKTGRAIYISHLDLMHTMQRAFSRAGLRIRYSEGFNPHPLISIALPLSVGTASECELMDVRLEGEADLTAAAEALNGTLPEGITVLEIYVPERKAAELKWLALESRFLYDEGETNRKAAALRAFFSAGSLVVAKKSKRGFSDFDLIPAIRTLTFTALEDEVKVDAVVSAQEPTFNPDLFCEALRQKNPELLPDHAAFTRKEVYDRDMNIFR